MGVSVSRRNWFGTEDGQCRVVPDLKPTESSLPSASTSSHVTGRPRPSSCSPPVAVERTDVRTDLPFYPCVSRVPRQRLELQGPSSLRGVRRPGSFYPTLQPPSVSGPGAEGVEGTKVYYPVNPTRVGKSLLCTREGYVEILLSCCLWLVHLLRGPRLYESEGSPHPRKRNKKFSFPFLL